MGVVSCELILMRHENWSREKALSLVEDDGKTIHLQPITEVEGGSIDRASLTRRRIIDGYYPGISPI